MEPDFYIYPILNVHNYRSVLFTCEDACLVVAASTHTTQRTDYLGVWRPVFSYIQQGTTPGSMWSTNYLGFARGVASCGFDGWRMSQFAKPGEQLRLFIPGEPSNVLYVITRSASPPVCVVKEFDF